MHPHTTTNFSMLDVKASLFKNHLKDFRNLESLFQNNFLKVKCALQLRFFTND